jgi:membrane protease YdiL (CAAX protease family)
MNSQKEALQFPADARPWLFLGLTLGFTWLFQFVAVVLQTTLPSTVVFVIAYFGSLAPLLVALGLLYWQHDRAYRRDFWQRLVAFRRISPVWYVVIFLFQPLISLLAALVVTLQGSTGIEPEIITQFIQQPLLIVPMVIWWLIFGPLIEEPGWRGYGLDGLQARHSALLSSLIIGAVWALWHLPLFWLDGTWQVENVGLSTLVFWLYMANIMLGSIVITWIYNSTNRSILAAILFHFSGNAFGELFALSQQAEVYNTLFLVVTALVIVPWPPVQSSD